MTTFAAWLFARDRNPDDPISAFTDLVRADEHYPGPQADLADWRKYLSERNDPIYYLEALDIAWDEYQLYILTQAWEENHYAH